MASAGLEQLIDEIKAIVLEADAVLARAAHAPSAPPGEAPDGGPAAAADDDAGGPIAEAATRLRAGAGRAAASAGDYVREHPWTSLGLAAAAGLCVGLWAKRK
jgi:ElaB/YqjD/DUF883 family membrane-anchored ribosome-binding protein